MLCCPNCFSDSFLARQILVASRTGGTCPLCNTHNASLIEPSCLYDLFGPLLDMYGKEESGELLAMNIQRDWGTFSLQDEIKTTDLLVAITGDESLKTDRYRAKVEGDQEKLERWANFRHELKHKNRFFPELIPDPTDLRNLFAMLTMPFEQQPGVLYRARNHTGIRAFRAEEMGMPPHDCVSHGRANPNGIPYLYLASDPETALAEVRPFKGDSVSVATFEVDEFLSLVDLRNPRDVISPFSQNDDDLEQLFRDVPFLDLLGEELSRPVGPKLTEVEYLSSQYLCEFIKHVNFEGVVYRSSLGPGYNVAFFTDNRARSTSVTDYHIDSIQLISSQVAQ